MTPSFRRLLIAVAIVMGVGAGTLLPAGLTFAKDEPRAARAALTVKTVKPQREKWPVTVSASGSLAAWQEAVIASETGGLRITQLNADVGTVVHKGQKLAQLAQEVVQAELDQQRARVAQAQAELAEARANADRARAAAGSSAMSEQLINQYLISQDKAQANLAAAEAQLKSPEIRLSQTAIIAVDDGVISSRSAMLGAVVPVGAELFRMVRQNRIEWRAEVIATQAGNIKSGQKSRLQLTNGETIEGTVRIAAPTFDNATRKTLIYVDLPASSSARPGMFAQGEILVGSVDTLTLQQGSVILRDGFAYVFEIGDGSRVVQRKVTTGRRVGDRVEIVEGLTDKAIVVATGGAFLNGGDLVRVEGPAETAKVNK